MEMPQCTYVFRITAADPCSYRLEGIRRTRAALAFTPPRSNSSLAENDWAQLQLLNERLVHMANALSLRFVFITRSQGAFVCEPTRAGTLRVLERCAHYDTNGAELPYVDGDEPVAHGAPVYSLLYSFEEGPRPRLYNFDGLSPLSTRVVGVPICLNQQRLQTLLSNWSQTLCPEAQHHSRCHVRLTDSQCQLRWLTSADGLARC